MGVIRNATGYRCDRCDNSDFTGEYYSGLPTGWSKDAMPGKLLCPECTRTWTHVKDAFWDWKNYIIGVERR